ncbi:uncharacterized protein (TIGR03905 family) [Hydrogenispora ethanolica]|uniref:ribonucleoside-diphosphate reductase n=1 Tax=Hydrogenispora ethanolica TaxID=1082276 RepID=A0A4R1R2X7_HYDET|nr:TIGR03905 family TSCPD domain-containing protein [Hydrogenispora ethanolica]TCL59741.1 uncharacterized protein (TIGR03905 family) [Hydrogenispora ethanolica]
MKKFIYNAKEVCSKQVRFSMEQGGLPEVQFESGCDGNLQALSRLVEGMTVAEVVDRLQGISCRGKKSSCPDQLARALERIRNGP